jgi:hypothetical protein
MDDIRTLLQEYHFDVLKDMADLLGVHPASTKKAAHIGALAPAKGKRWPCSSVRANA